MFVSRHPSAQGPWGPMRSHLAGRRICPHRPPSFSLSGSWARGVGISLMKEASLLEASPEAGP